MSQQALAELNKARDEILYTQRDCAWCKYRANSNKDLILHIWETHKPPKDPEYITLLKAEIAGV
jgi:hypothetical protein